jgi:hypothetical protein
MDELVTAALDLLVQNAAWLAALAALVTILTAFVTILAPLRRALALGVKRAFNWVWRQEASGVRNFRALASKIHPLLEENARIFRDHGPNAGRDGQGKIRDDLTVWHHLKRKRILPNNARIRCLMEANSRLIPARHKLVFEKMQSHIDTFEVHCDDPSFGYADHRFPKEFADLIREYAS